MALEGTLSYMDISHLLKVVGTSGKSGVLEIRWQEREARLYFQQGRLVRAQSNRIRDGIGTLLVRAGLLSPADLDRALDTQKVEGCARRLGAVLCDDFGVLPEDMARLLLEQSKQIVYDVFSWPGGRFTFQFRVPEGALDRFHHDAVLFIEDVGLEAGFLAREGVARERVGPGKRPILLLLHDPGLGDECRVQWREEGYRVTRCERVEEVVDLLRACAGGPAPLVVVEAGSAGVLSALREAHAEAPLVVLGREGTVRSAAPFVALPSPGELAGPDGGERRRAFLAALGEAVAGAVGGPGAGPQV